MRERGRPRRAGGPAFELVASKLRRPLLRPGTVVGLLMLPTMVGGLLAAVLLFKATGAAAQRWRAVTLLAYAVVGAFITDLVAGPWIGTGSVTCHRLISVTFG